MAAARRLIRQRARVAIGLLAGCGSAPRGCAGGRRPDCYHEHQPNPWRSRGDGHELRHEPSAGMPDDQLTITGVHRSTGAGVRTFLGWREALDLAMRIAATVRKIVLGQRVPMMVPFSSAPQQHESQPSPRPARLLKRLRGHPRPRFPDTCRRLASLAPPLQPRAAPMLASPASHPPLGSRLTPEQRARKSHLGGRSGRDALAGRHGPGNAARAGELRPVRVPDTSPEADAGLVRARATAARTLTRRGSNCRLFLLRHQRVHGGQHWTPVASALACRPALRPSRPTDCPMSELGLGPVKTFGRKR